MQKNLLQSCIPFGGEGFLSTKCHPTHTLMQVEHFPHICWCKCCGGISSKQAKLLVAACRGGRLPGGNMWSTACPVGSCPSPPSNHTKCGWGILFITCLVWGILCFALLGD